MDPLHAHWAANVRSARKRAGLPQSEVAAGCNVDQCTVSRWERGTLVPTDENKVVIARFFGQEPRELFDLVVPDVDLAVAEAAS